MPSSDLPNIHRLHQHYLDSASFTNTRPRAASDSKLIKTELKSTQHDSPSPITPASDAPLLPDGDTKEETKQQQQQQQRGTRSPTSSPTKMSLDFDMNSTIQGAVTAIRRAIERNISNIPSLPANLTITLPSLPTLPSAISSHHMNTTTTTSTTNNYNNMGQHSPINQGSEMIRLYSATSAPASPIAPLTSVSPALSESQKGLEINTSTVQGAIVALQRALESGDETLCMATLNCISRMVEQDTTKAKVLGKGGACELVLAIIIISKQSRITVDYGLRAIHNLSIEIANQNIFLKNNIHQILITLLTFHMSSVSVCEVICRVIVLFATDESRRTRFGSAGVCEAVISVLAAQISNAIIIEWACKAICSLCYCHAENRIKLGSNGTSELLLIAAQHDWSNESNYSSIISWICYAIAELSYENYSNRERLGESGAVDTLMLILRSNSNNTEIICAVLSVIESLGYPSVTNQIRFRLSGCCEIFVSIMLCFSKFQKQPLVVQSVCRAVRSVCHKNLEIGKEFGQANACEVIVSWLHHHIKDAEDVDSILWGLYALARYEYIR